LNVDGKDVHYDQGKNMGKDEVDDEDTFQLKLFLPILLLVNKLKVSQI